MSTPPIPPRTSKPPVSPPAKSTTSPPPFSPGGPQLPPLPTADAQDYVEALPQSPNTVQPRSGVGFGSCLQSCYEAINKRHDDELKALESFRVHIFNRAKAEREYADSLARINQKAQRGVANVNQSSAIVNAWTSFLEMSEVIQKQVSHGAAQMSGVLLQCVDQLIRDKRGAKKVFDAERARLDEEYHSSVNEVQLLRRDYRKYLNSTEGNKRKLEAALAKEPPKPQEQDRYRKRFVASAEKLHTCHNNYSLSILNANAHQEHYRTSLLPFCLDILQERMELQISEWKDAMLHYTEALDLTKVYEESFRKVYESLNAVDQETEYVQFIAENKKEQSALEYFEFDGSLLQSYCSPQAQSGKVVVNNLTQNNMKTRLSSLETDLEHHEKDIIEKQQGYQELLTSTPAADENGPLSPKADSAVQPPRHVQIATVQSEIKELGSKQARKKCQAALIKEELDSLGETTPPLFDPLGEGVDVKDLDYSLTTPGGGATVRVKGKFAQSMGTLRHGMKGGYKGLKKRLKKAGWKSRAGSASSGNGVESSVSPSTSGDPLGDGVDGGGGESDSDDSLYDVPPELPIEEEEWFFGDVDRKFAESKCVTNGDYLVRYSARQNKYVLTCNWNGAGKHFVIQQITDEMGHTNFRFESKAFPSIRELLDHHTRYGTPVTRASGAVVVKHVTKFDKWSVRHDDVQRGRKIGKGCFGDVFEGILLTTQQKVAVKTCRLDAVQMQDMDKFLKEAEILKQYDHPNIVRLIGVCAEKEPIYIIMELMPGGAFLDFLRKKGAHQPKKKIGQMCIDACSGMAYLEANKCIHRDLAARNCLVGENDVIKISDFGMSREEEGGIYMVSSGTRHIPIKWTAPEALNYGKYTSSSDVWSFGVLLWEAFSCGSAPYPGMSNQEARTQIENGYRMPPPTDTSEEVYGIMLQCWQYDAEERPDFATLLSMLQQAGEKIQN